jgi:CRP/FNR family transcriptional regulator, anaerobic regulatory protein
VIPIEPQAPPHRPAAVYDPRAAVCIACRVRRFALFGTLDDDALSRIHEHIADIALAPGEPLYHAGARGEAAFTVREGVLRLERSSERGDRRIVRLAGRASLVGMEAVLGQTYAADAVACTPVRACRLPRALVDRLAAAQPALARDLMKRWQGALDEAEEWLTELTGGSARWRMLRLLLKLTEYADEAGRVWLPTRQDMGAMLGMTVETASRLVAALRREALLEPVDERHARLDMAALMAALRRESGPPG